MDTFRILKNELRYVVFSYYVVVFLFFLSLNGCVSTNSIEPLNSEVEIEPEEISFDSVKTDISKISYLLGVNQFATTGQSRPGELVIEVQGQNIVLNGENINLNFSRILFKKKSARTYSVGTYFNTWGINAKLDIDKLNNTFTLTYHNKIIKLDKEVTLSSKERLIALVLLNYYDEIRTSNPYGERLSNLRSDYEAPIGRVYYGYTIGWGFTREQSIDDEQGVRGGAGEDIKSFQCKLLGTSTSCFYESIGCVTISTFKCTTNN
jgi:hypothetical protein